MKPKPAQLAPLLIALAVIVLVGVLHLLRIDLVERVERMSFDWRARHAVLFHPPVATNLGFVFISDASINFVKDNDVLGYEYGLYWPRQVYGRLVRELNLQGAQAVGFDVIFGELRPDHPPVQMADGSLMESDDYFALQLRTAGNVILADAKQISPPDLFVTNAFALGDISTDNNKDSDGVLRRARAFHIRTNWHSLFKRIEATREYGVNLANARIESNAVVLLRGTEEAIVVPLDSDGRFDLADLVGETLPPGLEPKAPPFTLERVWNLGIALAARELDLELNRAEVELARQRIVLPKRNGTSLVIPIEPDGSFYIDWAVRFDDSGLFKQPIEQLLVQERARLDGQTNLPPDWAGKLVLVGSTATGNDLTDRGATPIEEDTFLAGAHWNVANSVLTGRFIQRTTQLTDLVLIAILGAASAWFTWRLRILVATSVVAVVVVGYIALAWALYVQHRIWIPLVMPVIGALMMTYVFLVIYRVLFEQAEQRRVKSIFSRIVSPNIVHELLGAEKLALGGARREVTVLFADVRGFTEFTDGNQERAEAYVTQNNLNPEEREKYFDEQARETLATVNTYLALVADIVKKHDGTLDKYIGDCVMAFWGAPTPNICHARDCVRAAIEAQRCLAELNQKRADENVRRELENAARVSAGLPPVSLLPTLTLGSGINTGLVTVGLMGSEAHISNYTVFGREVNLASRLESLSGRGRILISGATHKHLLRDDPELAATCIALPPATVKGIRSAVTLFEVPWRTPGLAATPSTAGSDTNRTSADTSLLAAKNETHR